jgi:hypothetical protein
MKDINQQEQQLSSGYPGLLSFRLPQLITFNLPNTSNGISTETIIKGQKDCMSALTHL